MSTTSLIFAAVAAAILWWVNRQPAGVAPVSMPPLPGSPGGASLPPLPGAAPVGGGMSPLLLGAILVPWGLVAWSHLHRPEPAPDRPDDPVPSADGIDLRGKFTGPDAATHAAIVAALTLQTADAIHDDGKIDFDGDGRIDEPRLLTGRQIWELRNLMRAYHTHGVVIGDVQPLVRDEIKRYLDAKCGKSSGEVTPEQKATWEDAFREISKAATAAIKG